MFDSLPVSIFIRQIIQYERLAKTKALLTSLLLRNSFQRNMIRCTTLIALLVAIGLACVFSKGSDTEETPKSSAVHLKEDPRVDLVAEIEDQAEKNSDSDPEIENDPKRWRKKYKYRKYRRRRRRYYKPYTPKPCPSSRPDGSDWQNTWQGHLFIECPLGKFTSQQQGYVDCKQVSQFTRMPKKLFLKSFRSLLNT